MRKLLSLCIALMILLALSVPAVAVEEAETPLLGMLARVPTLAFEDGWLSFADYAVIKTQLPHAVNVGSAAEYNALTTPDARSGAFQLLLALSAGANSMLTNLGDPEAIAEATGVDLFQIEQSLETGIPLDVHVWLTGPFDPAAVRRALAGRGYQQIAADASPFDILAKDGDVSNGNAFDLTARDPNFIFGGNLGRSWPVAVDETMLIATPDDVLMRTLAANTGAFLSENKALTSLIKASGKAAETDRGVLAQLHVMTPAFLGLDVPDNPPQQTVMTQDNANQPVVWHTLAIAHVYTQDAQWVVLSLAFANQKQAEAAAEVLEVRYRQARLSQQGEPKLSEVVANYHGSLQTPRVVTEEGVPVLLMPIRFPKDEELETLLGKKGLPAQPFRIFTHMVMGRDLGWLSVGDWVQ